MSTRGWLIGALLATNVALLLAVLSCAHITAEGPAKRGLRHSIAVLTEVDAYVEGHFDELQEEARRTREPAVEVSGFAVAVEFDTQELLALDAASFRGELLERAAERVYDDGASAFHPDEEIDAGLYSAEGALRRGLDFLRPTPHRALVIATAVLACTAAALALLLAMRGRAGLLALGLAVFVGALALLLAAVGVRFALRLLADGTDDYFADEFLRLAQELTWAPIRNGMVLTAGGTLLAGAGAVLWRRGGRPRDTALDLP